MKSPLALIKKSGLVLIFALLSMLTGCPGKSDPAEPATDASAVEVDGSGDADSTGDPDTGAAGSPGTPDTGTAGAAGTPDTGAAGSDDAEPPTAAQFGVAVFGESTFTP